MTNILITGGLGYIGSELIKLYSGNPLFHLTIVDNNFLSEKVQNFNYSNIKFSNVDIRNKDSIAPLMADADIIFHLAGVTDVPRTESEQSQDINNLIFETGVTGTKNILETANKESKIIFPSTHVIYEGLENIKKNIEENEEPKPKLTYSESKYQSELDIISSDLNYIIIRLGSVHGLSGDSTRLNIMPNLFSKLAAQNLDITLHGRGEQLKSLVSVKDVARCLKFTAENDDLNKEIYHCVSENIKVKDVAAICKKFVNELNINISDEEIPNAGYGLSSSKLLNTGFEFKFFLEESIREMIEAWGMKKNDKLNKKNEKIEIGRDPYEDDRGRILNYYLENKINHIGLIDSKPGTVRGNHYHPQQTQSCLLIEGAYLSITKNLNSKNEVIESRLIKQGDLSIIKPNIAHTMIFLEDSKFINLVEGERSHENYGETHTFPYDLVDDDLAKVYLDSYKKDCRVCELDHQIMFHSFGLIPLANNLVDSAEAKGQSFPLELNYCKNCSNIQLNLVVNPKLLFDNYVYTSSTSQSFRDHFKDLVNKIEEKYNLKEDSRVVDIGSNDGVFLKPLQDKGIKAVGIEPASNLAELANKQNLYTINSYFDELTAKKILKEFGKVDIVTAFNVFAHSDHLKNITLNAFNILKDEGTFIIEVQSLSEMLEKNLFDNVYHEHVNYWSLSNLVNFFNSLDLVVNDFEKVDTHGGSLRVYVSKSKEIANAVQEFVDYEKNMDLSQLETFIKFSEHISSQKNEVLKKLRNIIESGKKVIFYGAPAKATTLLNYYGIDNEMVAYTIEDNQLKVNKYIPNTKIKIIGKESGIKFNPDVIIVLAWNFFESIKEENEKLFPNSEFITLNSLD